MRQHSPPGPGTQAAQMEPMQGSKAKYTAKQKRQARHIEASEKKRGVSSKRAAQIGYATVNKNDGGGKKSGSGRKKPAARKSHSKGGSHAAHVRAGKASHK